MFSRPGGEQCPEAGLVNWIRTVVQITSLASNFDPWCSASRTTLWSLSGSELEQFSSEEVFVFADPSDRSQFLRPGSETSRTLWSPGNRAEQPGQTAGPLQVDHYTRCLLKPLNQKRHGSSAVQLMDPFTQTELKGSAQRAGLHQNLRKITAQRKTETCFCFSPQEKKLKETFLPAWEAQMGLN